MDYKPLLPDKKIKTFRVSDDSKSDQELRIHELFSNLKKRRFYNWIESPLKSKEINNVGKYKGVYIYDTCDNVVLKKEYIQEFIEDLTKIIEDCGYQINNNKLFRDTIASYIYKLSNKND